MMQDWNAAWHEHHSVMGNEQPSSYWDGRVADFNPDHARDYAQAFIDAAGLLPGESVLDMGCGGGVLVVPLALAGHEVVAADYSQGMLDSVRAQIVSRGLKGVTPVRLAWQDDWASAGIPKVDVAFASRSLGSTDLWGSLLKLERQARRKVCITMTTESSPRYDPVLYDAVGRPREAVPEFVYGINVLLEHRRYPRVVYLDFLREYSFGSYDEACRDAENMLWGVAPSERAAFDAYCRMHIVRRKADSGDVWCYDHPKVYRWAFISWDVPSAEGAAWA